MKGKCKSKLTNIHTYIHGLIGGGPQGSLIGLLLYKTGCDDVANEEQDEDKLKYKDYQAVLKAVKTREKLK